VSRLPTLVLALSALGAEEPAASPAPPAEEAPLERLKNALEREPGLSPDLKQALSDALADLKATRAAAPVLAAAEKSPSRALLDRLQLYGDFRLRHETDFELQDRPTRNRERLRLRLGANIDVHPAFLAGLRISTGNMDDARSPHQSFDDGFDKIEMSLDRAFATYRPAFAPGFAATGGKFAHPFEQNPVYPELVWDADVQPAGGYAIWRPGETLPRPAWLDDLRVIAGEYALTEEALADEASAFIAQAAARLQLAPGLRATAAAGYWRYSGLTPDGSGEVLSENAGNATRDRNGDGTADDFRSRFEILNPMLAVSYERWRVPVTASAEYIENLRAEAGAGRGYAVGAAVGKAEKRGDVRIYYQWQALDQDAVLSVFTQDDFLRATNYRGHLAGLMVQVADPVGLHGWFLITRPEEPAPGEGEGYEWRLRVDLNIKL